MRIPYIALTVATAAALTACGGGGGSSARNDSSASPTASSTTSVPGHVVACDLIEEREALRLLGAKKIKPPTSADDARCEWHADPETDTTPYIAVAVDAEPDVYTTEYNKAKGKPGYRDTRGIGDQAFFFNGVMRVKKGITSFAVTITSKADSGKEWSAIPADRQQKYTRLALQASSTVSSHL